MNLRGTLWGFLFLKIYIIIIIITTTTINNNEKTKQKTVQPSITQSPTPGKVSMTATMKIH